MKKQSDIFPKSLPRPFPACDAALDAVLAIHGINDSFWRPTKVDREIADNFDVAAHLKDALERRSEINDLLPTDYK